MFTFYDVVAVGAAVAQLLGDWPEKRRVPGSNPAGARAP